MSPSSSTNCFRCQQGVSEANGKKYLALLVDAVNLGPSRVTSLQFDAGTRKAGSQSIVGFPGVVMGNLAMDVVGDVSLRDTVCAGGSDPGHDGSKVTEEVTIKSGQGTTGESELAGTIVRKEGVGMLQESDQYKPVVDPGKTFVGVTESGDRCYIPEVRNDIGAQDFKDSKGVDRVVQSSNPEQDANVRDDDLSPLAGGEHWSARAEVCDGKLSVEGMRNQISLTVGARGVVRLTGRVEHQVGRPANGLMGTCQTVSIGSGGKLTHQIACRFDASADRGITDSLPKFVHDLLTDRRTVKVFVGGIEGQNTEEGTSLRDEGLILGQVTGGSVVLGMRNTPRVKWNSETTDN
jgi:hypothetical protein